MRSVNVFGGIILLLAHGCPQVTRKVNLDRLRGSGALELRESTDPVLGEVEPEARHYKLFSSGEEIGILSHTGGELTRFYIYDRKGERAIELSKDTIVLRIHYRTPY